MCDEIGAAHYDLVVENFFKNLASFARQQPHRAKSVPLSVLIFFKTI